MKTRAKKSKWIFASILSLMLILTSVIVIAAATDGEVYHGICGTNLTWELDSDTGVLHVQGSGDMNTYDTGYAPWYGYRTIIKKIVVDDSVSSISKNAFYGCSNAKEIILPFVGESRTATGTNAKYNYVGSNSSIRKITITDTDIISDSAFENCSYVTEIKLNNKVKTIGTRAFYGCTNLDTVTLPNSINYIGSDAFQNCDSLEVIEIPSGVTNILSYTFYDCDKLINIKLHNDIESIGSYAFYSCDSLKKISFPEELQTIGAKAFMNCISLEAITITDNVMSIGSSAFSGCTNAETIVIGDGVTNIETSTFSGCTNLTNLYIGKSVETIASLAFSDLTNLQSITIPNNVLLIEAGAFKNCSSLKEISVPFVGESRTATGPNATFGYIFGYTTLFSHDTTLAEWPIPKIGIFDGESSNLVGYIQYSPNIDDYRSKVASYKDLGWTMSDGWSDSSSEEFIDYKVGENTSGFAPNKYDVFKAPDGTIWQYSCNNYKRGYSQYTLQSYYYYIPSSISKVTITDTTNIGTAAFMNCSNVTEINIESSVSQIGDCAFRNFGVPSNSTEDFVISGDILLAYNGTDTNVIIPEEIRIIAPRAFYGNTKILSVQLSAKTEYVGANAFYNCKKATVHVPRVSDKLTVETDAFTGAGSVSYLTVNSYTNGNDTYYYTVDSNGNAIIVDCETTNTQITLPTTLGGYPVTEVGYRGLANCTTLNVITIPNNIVKINAYAFYGCSALTQTTIPNTCTYIGEYAFAECTQLISSGITEGVIYIGDHCYENCSSLSDFVVPDTCTYLGKYAFNNCTSLASVTIGITLPSINEYTFYNCEQLKTVVIGIKVESIGEYAFYNTALERFAAPNALKSIGKYAFAENKALTRVSLKSGIQSIGDGAFFGDSLLATINLPTTLETIGAYAFYDCQALTSVTIPELVTVISDYTYANCSALTTVKVNAETVIVGDKAFAYCTSLNSFTTEGTITSVGEKAFYRNILTTFDFKNVIEYIGADAFAFNPLTAVTLPSSITYIGDQAFVNCAQLSNISMPDSVTYVGAYAFSGTANNLTITIRYNSGKVADYMLYNTDVYKIIMEDGITEIGKYAFALCHDLAEITFPHSLQTIGDYAFYDNRGYTELTLPNTLLSIGQYAFARGYQFVQINVPDSVRSIGEYAFYREEASNYIDPQFTVKFYYNNGVIAEDILDGQHIQHIILDDNIHTVGNNAFSNCANLVDIILPDTISSFGTDCFLNDNSIILNVKKVDGLIDDSIYRERLSGVGTINVINTNVGDYAFYGNSTVLNILTTGVQTIGKYAFANNSALLAVTVYGNTIIDDYGFAENSALQDVIITGETNIGDYAFSNDVSLLKTTVVGKSNVGNYSFYNCNSMTDFIIDGTIVRIGEHAFDSCKALKAMALPTTVNYIGSYAFYDCNSMSSINIPNGIEKILSHTFYGCVSLENIEIPNSVTDVEGYAFYGCVALKNISISNCCKTIGENAFYNCKALTELIIPDSVMSIGAYAFRSCSGITELVFSNNVEEIGACAFYDCKGLRTVKLGKKIIELGDRMFYGCVNLESLYVYAPLSYIDELAFYGADYVTVYCGLDNYMISFFDDNGIFYEILNDLVYEYKITFVTDNGEIIGSATYASGATVIPPSNPTKMSDNVYYYVFAGWDQEFTPVGGNKTYTASFTPVYIEYTVVFKDYNGNTISSGTYHYGDTVTAPSDPTRVADNTYTYAFAGWNNAVVECAGDATYTATYTPTYIEYTVVFKDYDGEIISSKTYHYGDAVTAPSNPVREADLVGTYSFKSWDNAIVACAGDATYTAVYDIAYIDYTVVFKNHDGDVISTKTYHYGDSIIAPADPMREADNTYTYAFSGWDKSVISCAGNATYTATYTPTYIKYTVVFKDYDGETISSKDYHYGDTITVPSYPTRAADTTYTYSFAGWDTNVASTCGGSATYTATYTPTYIEYTVVFKDYDGEIISTNTYHYGDAITIPTSPTRETDVVGSYTFKAWDSTVVNCAGNATYTATYDVAYTDYTVIFKNYNGDVLSTNTYHYGDTVVVPSAPSKPADETYTYAFIGWDNTVTKCEGNTTYTAEFAPTNVEYTVVFKDENGTVLSTKTYYYGAEVVIPNAPSKAADNTYTYTFAGWDKEVVDCVADATYTATYTPVYINYTVTFTDYDGSTIKTVTYHYGETIASIADPTRASDETYTYAFAGWDKALGTCKGNTTFKAIYTPTYIDYTVIFKNEDGTVLSRNTYHYGDAITAPATPTKAADNTYTYTFKGWDQAVVDCAGNATYTATYNANYIGYTVIFKNADGTVLSTKTYHYGEFVTAPKTPTKAADTTYTYTFNGWDKEVVDCAGNATYIATYNANYIDYTVIFKNADGTVLSTEKYHYGDDVTAPTAPTKAADNTYTYTFKSWDKEVVACAGDATYTATYNLTYIDYTVIFKNEDGSVISTKTYHYGDTVKAPKTPTKAADNTYTYSFTGWDSAVVACNGDKVYTATFTPVFIEYTVVFKDWNGNVISSNEYHYGQSVTKPSNPTRDADNTYTYAFAGWDKTVTSCTESTVYTATYSSTYIEYEVVFKNYDGTILSTNKYHYGDTVAVPEAPTKPADESYTYRFAGWDSEVTACFGNKTYIATFNPTNVEYTVVFKDHNGNVISSETYHFGDEVVVPQAPSRNADNTYTYTFKDWGKTVAETCVGDVEYTANYEATHIEYNIKFFDWDGSLIQTVKYHYGDTITAIADPERASDETYTYTFLSWNKALGTCTGNASFTAQYESAFINYTVVFKDYDGSVISRKTYHFGDSIVIPANPIRTADETYIYTFKDWGNISTICNGNKEYTATYNATYIGYTVVFKDAESGEIYKQDVQAYGSIITLPDTPTKEGGVFESWNGYREGMTVSENVEFTAVWHMHTCSEAVVENQMDATCTSDGSYDSVVYCSVCNIEVSREAKVIDKLGHSFTDYKSNNDATYTEDGTEIAKCDRCAVTDTRTDEDSALGLDQKFKDEMSALSKNANTETAYAELYSVLQTYATLSDAEKTNVATEYAELQKLVDDYNAKVQAANAELADATEIAFAPIATTGFVFLAALWFILKKKFFI